MEFNVSDLDNKTASEISVIRDEWEEKYRQAVQNKATLVVKIEELKRTIIETQLSKKELEIILVKAIANERTTRSVLSTITNKFFAAKESGI